MKLCRFDLAESPGTPRSGIVYGGKVYETDGSNPVGVHDWTEARLLAPVGMPSSYRLFPSLARRTDPEGFDFRYLNPVSLAGPNMSLGRSEMMDVAILPCLAVVVAGGGLAIPVFEADGVVLGLTLVNVFYQPSEGGLMDLPAWSFDVGSAIGPALTTPDELDDHVTDESAGRQYEMDVRLFVNGAEVFQTSTASLPATLAELLSYASLTCPLRQGDLVAASLTETPLDVRVKSGDSIRLVCEPLGTLSSKLA